MTAEEACHREAIRALVMRFHIHSDRGQFADVARCFTSDGTACWQSGGGRGRAAIEANLKGATANPAVRFVRHHVTITQIELAEDMRSGRGRIQFFCMANAGADHAGFYLDDYAREDGEWLIASREVHLEWQAAASVYPQHIRR